jgi:poly-gamma-glutamate synthesis protein (capsule biosynthesis protein)
VREQIGDEFTLENLKAKYEQTMNMNVEPSEKTYLLNVRFSWDGSMIDKTTGETVYDNDSIHYWDYYNQLYSEE